MSLAWPSDLSPNGPGYLRAAIAEAIRTGTLPPEASIKLADIQQGLGGSKNTGPLRCSATLHGTGDARHLDAAYDHFRREGLMSSEGPSWVGVYPGDHYGPHATHTQPHDLGQAHPTPPATMETARNYLASMTGMFTLGAFPTPPEAMVLHTYFGEAEETVEVEWGVEYEWGEDPRSGKPWRGTLPPAPRYWCAGPGERVIGRIQNPAHPLDPARFRDPPWFAWGVSGTPTALEILWPTAATPARLARDPWGELLLVCYRPESIGPETLGISAEDAEVLRRWVRSGRSRAASAAEEVLERTINRWPDLAGGRLSLKRGMMEHFADGSAAGWKEQSNRGKPCISAWVRDPDGVEHYYSPYSRLNLTGRGIELATIEDEDWRDGGPITIVSGDRRITVPRPQGERIFRGEYGPKGFRVVDLDEDDEEPESGGGGAKGKRFRRTLRRAIDYAGSVREGSAEGYGPKQRRRAGRDARAIERFLDG